MRTPRRICRCSKPSDFPSPSTRRRGSPRSPASGAGWSNTSRRPRADRESSSPSPRHEWSCDEGRAMKALLFERKLAKYAAAAVAGRFSAGRGATVGPLSLTDIDEPELPGEDWVRVRPRLAGICGSDLATIDGHSSRYFEPIVSFPFVPGHEVVGELDDDRRVVLVPILTCVVRGIEPLCAQCAAGRTNRCERVAFGHLSPGLQTGFCEDTGGGWSLALVAHESQLHAVPD